jgi:hypothetical protein
MPRRSGTAVPRQSGKFPDEASGRVREKYRDNDDMRDPVPADERVGSSPDTKSEARGDARENIGRTARGTAARPTGPEGNDKTRRKRSR